MNLPKPELGTSDKETINNLFDTVLKLRKELEYVLAHLDEKNMPMINGIVGDIKSNHTAIEQTDTQISLLATDLTGAKAQLIIQAGAITSLVTDVSGAKTSIIQNATQISAVASDLAGAKTSITQSATQIASVASDLAGAKTQIIQSATQISLLVTDVAGAKTSITQQAGSIGVLATDINNAKAQLLVQADQISLMTTNINGNAAQISIQAGQISSKVSANGILSAINQSAEVISIDAERINLSGVTVMTGLSIVNGILRVGQTGESTSEIRLTQGQSIQGSSDGAMIINTNNYKPLYIGAQFVEVNGSRLATWSDVSSMIGDYVTAGAGQSLKLQIYNGSLEVYKDGSYFGTIGFS